MAEYTEYTINKIKLPNNDICILKDTWRGIQDNLTSSSNTTESLSAKQGYLLANGSARDNTKVSKSGDTMTGSLIITKAGQCEIEVNNTQTTNPNQVTFIVDSSGNGGIYSRKHSKWVVYSDTDGNVALNGNANTASAVALSGVTEADNLKAIEALSETSGFLKKTAANTWTLDTNTYLTSVPTISITDKTSGTLPVTRGGTGVTTIENIQAGKDGDGNTISSTYLKLSGGILTGDLGIVFGNTDKFLNFWFSTNKTAGSSWRLGALGSGSGDTNYFVIQSGTSIVTETAWSNVIRIGQNTYDVAFGGNIYPLTDNTKTLGTSSNKWSNVYSTTFTGDLIGNAATATKFASSQSITLTGDTTGTVSSQAGWSITTKTDRLSTVNDNRTVATIPNDYSNKIIFQGLKTNSSFDSPSTDTYSYVIGLRGWSDSSNGKAHEFAFNDSGINHRIGSTTSWENWEKIITSGNYTDYTVTKTGSGASGTWGINITGHASQDLPLSGGTMTGKITFNKVQNAIAYTGTKALYDMIKFIDNTNDGTGNGISIGGGGATIIGGGESANEAMAQVSGGNEILYLCNDGDVNVFTNMQDGWASRKTFTFGSNGTLTASAFSGPLTGNVTGNCTGAFLLSSTNNDDTAMPDSIGPAFEVYKLTGESNTIGNDGNLISMTWDNSTHYGSQIFVDTDSTYNISLRQRNSSGVWQTWKRIPMGDGTGASGTWGISISGNAATATKATQDGNGNTISSTYLKITGDGTIEGRLIAKKAGDAYVQAYNSNTGVRVYLDSDTPGDHGIWSGGYYSNSGFVNSGKWLIKRDTSGSAVIDLNLKLTSPLGVAYGGTGATNKWSALNNLGIEVGFTDITTAADHATLSQFTDKRYVIISTWFYNQNTTAIPYTNSYGTWIVYFYNQSLVKKSTTGRLYYAYIDTGSNQFTDEEVN